MISNKRNLGIDLLRMVSMFMVVMLHTLGSGGLLGSVTQYSVNYNVVWFLEIAAYCAVNCYALITGYVSYGSNFKYSKIIGLWLQVVFYTLGITLIFNLFMPSAVGIREFIGAALPVITKQYWYFAAYFGLFFFIPFMNQLINKFSKKEMERLIITCVILFSILPTMSTVVGNILGKSLDLFNTMQGYSILWLMVLYIIGGYFKKYGFPTIIKPKYCIAVYIFCVLITWLEKIVSERLILKYLGQAYSSNAFLGYTSPFILICGLCIFIAFANWNIKNRILSRGIIFLAPASFGVYIIHEQELVWRYLMSGRFASYASFSAPMLIISVILTVATIYILCSFIDLVRIKLFKKLNVNKFANFIVTLVKSLVSRSFVRLWIK